MRNIAQTVAVAALMAFNLQEVEEFVNGLLTGLVQDDSLTKVQACLKDAKSVEVDMSTAIADFEKKDLADIIAGAQVMYHLLQSIDTDISDCEGMKDDAARIENWAKIFQNPSQLVQTIMANAVANMSGLKADIEKIPVDVSSGDMKDLGMDVADILTKTLGPVPGANPKAEWLEYYEAPNTSSFPSFSALHAHCAMQTTISSTCDDAYKALNTIVNTANFDPAGGLYAVKQETSDQMIWVTRTTPTKHYVDDIEFLLSGTGSTCTINAKSQSQSLSYYDYDTNYCNMYNVFKSSGVTFTPVTTS